MKFISVVYHMFDVFEDHVRGTLSRHPFIYTFVGGTGVVLFWRGVWHTADYLEMNNYLGNVLFSPVGSMILGIMVLLGTGLFVSVFIGDSIIMSGIKNEKKTIEKAINQVETSVQNEKKNIKNIENSVEEIEKKVKLKKAPRIVNS